MAKSYASPERIDIRTEAHLLDSDIYLSRATSAFSREDYQSAQIFAITALDDILEILSEIAMEPFSNSHFIERMEHATAKLEMPGLFDKYLDTSKLNDIDDSRIRDKLELFKTIWKEISITTKSNVQKLRPTHFKVKANLDYYLNPAFLQGVIMRTNFLIDSEKIIEASHYLTRVFLDIAENYAWLRFSSSGVRINWAILMRLLRRLEEKNPKNYDRMVNFLNLNNIGKAEASDTINKTRETVLKIRKDRKVLIKNYSIKS
jgi:hypothetical protein